MSLLLNFDRVGGNAPVSVHTKPHRSEPLLTIPISVGPPN
jgi:hypothetical protein